MKRTWSPDELAAHWTPTDAERQPLPGRVDHNRLRFAAHLTCLHTKPGSPNYRETSLPRR